MGPEDDGSTCLQHWMLGRTLWPVTPVMHEGHMETEELPHEGLNLGAVSAECPEGPECMEKKADDRVPLLA